MRRREIIPVATTILSLFLAGCNAVGYDNKPTQATSTTSPARTEQPVGPSDGGGILPDSNPNLEQIEIPIISEPERKSLVGATLNTKIEVVVFEDGAGFEFNFGETKAKMEFKEDGVYINQKKQEWSQAVTNREIVRFFLSMAIRDFM